MVYEGLEKFVEYLPPFFQNGGRKPEEAKKFGTETDIRSFQRLNASLSALEIKGERQRQ